MISVLQEEIEGREGNFIRRTHWIMNEGYKFQNRKSAWKRIVERHRKTV